MNTAKLVDVLGKFKDLKRKGWIDKNVSYPESDADHSFSVAFLALLLAPDNLNKQKCLEMALIHDLAEIYSGDCTPSDNISAEEKAKKESEAVDLISRELQWPKLRDLFAEYEAKNTKESIFINALDKLDNVITAAYYEQNMRTDKSLISEFGKYAEEKISGLNEEKLLFYIKEILNKINQSSQDCN